MIKTFASFWKVGFLAAIIFLSGGIVGYVVSHSFFFRAALVFVEYEISERELEAVKSFRNENLDVSVYAQKSLIADLDRKKVVQWVDEKTYAKVAGMAYARLGVSYHYAGEEDLSAYYLKEAEQHLSNAGIPMSSDDLVTSLTRFRENGSKQ